MDTVSILIPAYNDEDYVGESVQSALAQTYSECEVIVVDDGSTDDTVSKVRKYDSVTLITQTNLGAPAARNRALESANGEYIQFLDADDLLHPRKVEAQIQRLEDSPPGTVAVSPTCYFQDGQHPEEGRPSRGNGSLDSDDPVQWLIDLWTPGEGWGMVQTGAWLAPNSLIEEAGPWKEYVSPDDDGEFFTRVLLASNGIRYVGEGCVYYRKHADTPRLSDLRSREALKGWMRSITSKCEHLLPHTTGEQREQAARGLARQYWSLALDAYPSDPAIAALAEQRAADLGHPEPLRSVSENGWKGAIAQRVESHFGWRAARWLQDKYHGAREKITEQLSA